MSYRSQLLRLCMIGAGTHASRHLYPNFHRINGAKVVANCDLDEAKAKRWADAFGIERSYTDYRKMIETERPDGVLVCVNSVFHGKVAPELMQMGCHVYTEKPTADTLEDCRIMLETSRATGKICMTGHKKRFAPAYVKARDFINSGEFGRPTLLTVFRTRTPLQGERAQNYLWEWGCHLIDLIPFLFGPVKQVSAFKTPDSTHAYSINLRFENGAVGNFSVSDRPGAVWEEVTAVGGDLSRIEITNSIFMTRYHGGRPVDGHGPSFAQDNPGEVETGFLGELQEFVDAIREQRTPEANIEQSFHTMAIYEAIQRSVRNSGALEGVDPIPDPV